MASFSEPENLNTPSVAPNGDADKKELAQEMERENAKIQAEIFLDRDMLVKTIEAALKSLRDGDQGDPVTQERNGDGTFTPYGLIQHHQDRFLPEWGQVLLESAVETTGSERMRYALALKHLRLLTSETVFDEVTKSLHITPRIIEDLLKKGAEEQGTKSFLNHGY